MASSYTASQTAQSPSSPRNKNSGVSLGSPRRSFKSRLDQDNDDPQGAQEKSSSRAEPKDRGSKRASTSEPPGRVSAKQAPRIRTFLFAYTALCLGYYLSLGISAIEAVAARFFFENPAKIAGDMYECVLNKFGVQQQFFVPVSPTEIASFAQTISTRGFVCGLESIPYNEWLGLVCYVTTLGMYSTLNLFGVTKHRQYTETLLYLAPFLYIGATPYVRLVNDAGVHLVLLTYSVDCMAGVLLLRLLSLLNLHRDPVLQQPSAAHFQKCSQRWRVGHHRGIVVDIGLHVHLVLLQLARVPLHQ